MIGKRCSVCHYYIKKAKLKGGPPILKKTFGVTVAVVKSLFRKPNDKNRNFQIIDTDRIRVRQFYDSKWFIYLHDGGEQKSIQITRDDMEEKNSLMNRLRECTSVDDIRALMTKFHLLRLKRRGEGFMARLESEVKGDGFYQKREVRFICYILIKEQL